MKKINYRHFICVFITLVFVALSVFVFPNSIYRLIESVKDFGLSMAYYFCELVGLEHNISPTINTISKYAPTLSFPTDYNGFKDVWNKYWIAFVNKDYITTYLIILGGLLIKLCVVLMFVAPFIVLLGLLIKHLLELENNKYNKDTLPLKCFKLAVKWLYKPLKDWLLGLYSFIQLKRLYLKLWLFIWLINFNIIAIIISFVAFYFYLTISFNFANIFIQIYKLVMDLYVLISFVPIWIWIIVVLKLLDGFRKKIGYARLWHYELRNRGFINERPLVLMLCGTMGKGKTTVTSDIALSQEIMLREKALEKLIENDLKFPNFSWICLENELKKAMNNHKVYNLATCKQFIKTKYEHFKKDKTKENCFNYDFELFGEYYNDDLKVIHLFEVLESYAQLYFIYIIQSSLIISNYSIRTDNTFINKGNFPLWSGNFFRKDSRLIDNNSRYAHIIDFDSFRLGCKVIENNPKSDIFEFGVVVITEIGKERGNNLELKEIKKVTRETNQKNDLFNSWLKMVRHSATVDNFPFVRIITDEQRVSSWGADARELCDIVYVKERSQVGLTMPFFTLGELLYSWFKSKFMNFYVDYRFNRGDNTLFMYVVKSLFSKVNNYYIRIYNRFSYYKLSILVESGDLDGKKDKKSYYIMPKKIYSKRFSTDCFSDYYTVKALNSKIGLDDLEEYKAFKATFEELVKQNSYFINSLIE